MQYLGFSTLTNLIEEIYHKPAYSKDDQYAGLREIPIEKRHTRFCIFKCNKHGTVGGRKEMREHVKKRHAY